MAGLHSFGFSLEVRLEVHLELQSFHEIEIKETT